MFSRPPCTQFHVHFCHLHLYTRGGIQEPDEDKAVAVTGAETRRTKPEEFSGVKIRGTRKEKQTNSQCET